MKRRNFVTLLGGALVWSPRLALAQQLGATRKVGVLSPNGGDRHTIARVEAFRRELAALGWSEGRTVQLDLVYASGSLDLSSQAATIVSRAPDAILAYNAATVTALRKLTHTIPIVFLNVPDPVGEGFVSSLARPGGNVTGFTNFDNSMGTKWLQLLKEIAPHVTRVVVAYTPRIRSYRSLLNLIDAGAKTAGMSVVDQPLLTPVDLRRLADLIDKPNTGLIALPNFFVAGHVTELVALTAQTKAPAIYTYPNYIPAGGLMCYGASEAEMYRNAAAYVSRILHGARPQDLPVQNPTKYDLSINLKTAKTLGLTVPPSLLIQANEVIR